MMQLITSQKYIWNLQLNIFLDYLIGHIIYIDQHYLRAHHLILDSTFYTNHYFLNWLFAIWLKHIHWIVLGSSWFIPLTSRSIHFVHQKLASYLSEFVHGSYRHAQSWHPTLKLLHPLMFSEGDAHIGCKYL